MQVGVFLSKELMNIAGRSLKANITTLGPLVLPWTEQARFLANFFCSQGQLLRQQSFAQKVWGDAEAVTAFADHTWPTTDAARAQFCFRQLKYRCDSMRERMVPDQQPWPDDA